MLFKVFLCLSVCVGSVGLSWVVLLSAVLCIIILMLPLSTDNNNNNNNNNTSLWSSLVHCCVVSVHQKLIAAYILGTYTPRVLSRPKPVV